MQPPHDYLTKELHDAIISIDNTENTFNDILCTSLCNNEIKLIKKAYRKCM